MNLIAQVGQWMHDKTEKHHVQAMYQIVCSNLNVFSYICPSDSKPTKDDTNPISRSTGLPKARKSKVTSTVTRPGPGHLISSPVDKYLNGRPYDRDINNGGMVAKSRVVTGKYTVLIWGYGSKYNLSIQATLVSICELWWWHNCNTGMSSIGWNWSTRVLKEWFSTLPYLRTPHKVITMKHKIPFFIFFHVWILHIDIFRIYLSHIVSKETTNWVTSRFWRISFIMSR